MREPFLFIHEENEVQRKEIICLKSHSCQMAQLGFPPKSSWLFNRCFSLLPSALAFFLPQSCWISMEPESNAALTLLVLMWEGCWLPCPFSFSRDFLCPLGVQNLGGCCTLYRLFFCPTQVYLPRFFSNLLCFLLQLWTKELNQKTQIKLN